MENDMDISNSYFEKLIKTQYYLNPDGKSIYYTGSAEYISENYNSVHTAIAYSIFPEVKYGVFPTDRLFKAGWIKIGSSHEGYKVYNVPTKKQAEWFYTNEIFVIQNRYFDNLNIFDYL